jgi:heme a synthase
METRKPGAFAKFAWFALAYNLIVILWGVFLRASYSGDGCGQHWLTCGGEAIPTAPELKTVIEFSHRITTALGGLVVVTLAVWAFLNRKNYKYVNYFAAMSLLFILIEGAIGGGLVLTGNTAANWTPTRPYWTAGHLINTFVLIAFLALTAWAASGTRTFTKAISRRSLGLAAAGVIAVFVVSVTGSMAALTTMLFPAESLSQGVAMDFAPDSHPLLRLRILHPMAAIVAGVGIFSISGWVRANSNEGAAQWWSRATSVLILSQIGFGAATLLMLGPIVMQLGHLLLADLLWIAFVLMFANHFSSVQFD